MLDKCETGEMVIVGSDINAWMGGADTSLVDTFDLDEDTSDPVLGQHGLPETNVAGVRLKTKLAALNLVAATTFFPHNGSGKGGSFLFKGKDGKGSWKQLDHFFLKKGRSQESPIRTNKTTGAQRPFTRL